MEWVSSPVLLLLVTFPFLFALLIRFHRSGGVRLPPGPIGLPPLGRLPLLSPDLHRCFADLARAYGPILSLRLGTELYVVITSSSAAAEVLRVHDAVFANRAPPVVATIVTGDAHIAGAPNGPLWRMLRKVAVRELLNSSVLDSLALSRRKELRRVVDRLRENAHDAVGVHGVAHAASLGMITSMLWGGELGHALEEEATEVLGGIMDVVGAPNISDFLPALAPLDLQGLQRKMRGLWKRYDAIFDHIVRNSEEKRRNADEAPKDFLQLLLDLVRKKDLNTPLQLHHDLLAGSTDTTSSTIEWAMSELVRNPEVMSKAREELDAVVGGDAVLEESDLPKLRYLDAVVKETLRLHPVAPFLIPRAASAGCKVGGYDIPMWTRVLVNVWAIQRDSSLWEEPLEFKPERFLKDKWDSTAKSFDYFPFGGGRRMCPGINLGERMVMHILGSFLHAFEWRLPQGVTGVDIEEKFGLVLRKKEPLVLVPFIRMKQL